MAQDLNCFARYVQQKLNNRRGQILNQSFLCQHGLNG